MSREDQMKKWEWEPSDLGINYSRERSPEVHEERPREKVDLTGFKPNQRGVVVEVVEKKEVGATASSAGRCLKTRYCSDISLLEKYLAMAHYFSVEKWRCVRC